MIEKMKRLKRELKYKGSILDIYQDTMEFANGKQEKWDFVSHRMGAAAILPVLPDGRIVMVRQYRNALERETIEIPAGARDSKTEDTKVCATRELEEETGVQYVAARKEEDQVSLTAIGEGEVLDALRRCQPDTLTPIEAMSLIYEWKQKLN